MANHPSSLKRNRQSIKRKARNRTRKTEIQDLLKTLATTAKTEVPKIARTIQSKIDRAARKGTLHWKTAARKVSRLAQKVLAGK
jgi:small subunit ribosomal protein S20